MRRGLLIGFLAGLLVGGGGAGGLAYVAISTNSDRLSIVEADTHKMKREFDLGIRMIAEGPDQEVERVVVSTGSNVKKKVR